MIPFKQSLATIFPQMVEWRRHLHRHPELSFHESETALFIKRLLEQWGIEVRSGVGGHGLTALIRGAASGPTVALRADMDALPIQDEKKCEYRSTVPGVMHACGHDAHTATLLGAAKLLQQHRNDMRGNIRLIFQPAEEICPGGAAGMIDAGVLEDVDVIYGVHLWTPFRAGIVATRPGALMAAADEFTIRLIGKGGHGGLPHHTIDSLLVGAQLISNLQSIVSRTVDPLESCVVSVGSFHAGSVFNVIAEKADISGTVRTFDEAIRKRVSEQIGSYTEHVCTMYGADYTYNYNWGYPPVVNDKREAARSLRIAEALFGLEQVVETAPIMAGEDFSYYLQRVPGCFVFVGAGDERKENMFPHHHPKFDIDESAMLTAAEWLLGVSWDYLNQT